MIKDFETVKSQLRELAEVINTFKSEAVQLKLIEILFKGSKVDTPVPPLEPPAEVTEVEKTGTTGKRKKTKKVTAGENEKKTSAPKGRPGPLTTLEQLVNEGFFKTKRTIGDVVKHCKVNLTITYKSTDLSGVLMKLVRDKKLKRVQNPATNQYEYSNS
jgi:hypothetical protein